MPSLLASLGWLSPLSVAVAGGASGVQVPIELRDTDGVLQNSIDLSGAGVVQVSVDGGDTWSNRVGAAPVNTAHGVYRYTPDNTEVTTAQTVGFLLVNVTLAGYQTITERADVYDNQLASSQIAITNAINAAVSTLNGTIASAIATINAHTDTEVSTEVDAAVTTLAGDITASTTAVNAHTDSVSAASDSAVETAINAHTDSVVAAAETTIAATVNTNTNTQTAAIIVLVQRLLGLHGDNALLDGGAGQPAVVYNSRRVMTAGRLRVFADVTSRRAATAGAADDADHEVFRWSLVGTDNGHGLDATFARDRTL